MTSERDKPSKKPRHVHRRRFTRLLVYLSFITVVVALRGFVMARLAGGRYPLPSFCFDVIALTLLMGSLHLFDRGLQAGIRRLLKPDVKCREVIVQTIRVPFVLLVLFPFLLVALTIHPQRIACTDTPQQFGLEYEQVILDSGGVRLDAWYIPGTNDSGPVVVVAHGVGANKQNFLPAVNSIHSLGYPLIIADFRAHGDSQGLTTTYGLRESEDVRGAHDWIARRHPGRPVCAVGYSMGGAAVARAAHEYGIFDRIVLDSTFSSLRSIAHRRFLRYFGSLESVAWKQGCFWAWVWTGADFAENATESYVSALSKKTLLIIHGKDDSVIPFTESIRIWESLGRRPKLWLIEDAGHMETIFEPGYNAKIQQFFEGRSAGSLDASKT